MTTRLKIIIAVVILLLLGLQYQLWFSNGGVFSILHLRHAITQQKQALALNTERNNIMIVAVKHEQQSPQRIKDLARENLGMVGPKEKFYRIVHS